MNPKKQQQQEKQLFATEIGGPFIFTFYKVLSIEKKPLCDFIQTCGGKVIEYGDRNKFTIVLAKKNRHSSDKIQFNLKYIKECKNKNKTLPLESYRLDKKSEFGCYFSKPLGSKTCIFSKHIQKGKCKKHNVSRDHQNADLESDNEAENTEMVEKLKNLKNTVYAEKKPRVKIEMLDISGDGVVEMQESQSFESETCYEKSQSLLMKKVK